MKTIQIKIQLKTASKVRHQLILQKNNACIKFDANLDVLKRS